MFSYWCAYGPESKHRVTNDNRTTSAQTTTKKKRSPRESIKVGCNCHFIMRRLFQRPEDAIITYTHCRHVDTYGIVCHGENAIGKPKTFNFAPHLSSDIRVSVEQMIKDGFNVSMVWDKFLSDVEHKSGELFTGVTQDTLMTRQDILNIYHNIRRKEYVKDDRDPVSVDCWYNQFPDKFFYYQKQDIVQGIPFIIGIQTGWMRSMMVRHSHNDIISMDSTFSTNMYGVR